MSKSKAIEKIQYAVMQVASVYAELDSLFGLFIIGVFILLADYIIFDIIS